MLRFLDAQFEIICEDKTPPTIIPNVNPKIIISILRNSDDMICSIIAVPININIELITKTRTAKKYTGDEILISCPQWRHFIELTGGPIIVRK